MRQLPVFLTIQEKKDMDTIKSKGVKAYLKLVAKVLKVDKKAAKYLLKKAPSLEDFVYSGSLSGCFDWGKSPQGEVYWRNIHYCLCLGQ